MNTVFCSEMKVDIDSVELSINVLVEQRPILKVHFWKNLFPFS